MATKQKVQLLMPEMGESVTEGTVLEWHVSEGDSVEEGQTMVEVSTDKVDAEVPAPASGTVTKILVQVDEEIEVGKPLAEIDPNGGPPEKTVEQQEPTEERGRSEPGRDSTAPERARRRRPPAARRRPRTTPRCRPASRWRAAGSRS